MWRTSIFRTVGDCKKYFKAFPSFEQNFEFLKTSFADIFRNMHFLCATKNSPLEAVGKD